MNFYDGLESFGDNTALIEPESAMSYGELAAVADDIFTDAEPRNLAFLVCANNAEAIAGYLGMLRKRIVPVMISKTLDKALYNNLLAVYKPRYIWAPKDFDIGVSADIKKVISFWGQYSLFDTGESAPAMDDELAVLLTTSGSTGSPKLVRQTYGNINSNAESIADYLDIRPDDRAITSLPMNYTYGLSIMHSHFLKGGALVLTEKTVMEKEFWKLLKEKKATTFGGVPYTYEMLDKLRFLNMDFPDLRYITQAGGKLSEELHLKFAQGMRDKGKAFIIMYGATEATARMSYLPAEFSVEKAGSIGIAIPGGRFELVDDDGNLIEGENTTGELVYYGDNVTWGYAENRDDLKGGDERRGRLETGDLAVRDADGYYYITGRKKRFLKIFGNRVNLREIEELLEKKGHSCACVGEDDNIRIYTTSDDTDAVTAYLADTMRLNSAAFTAVHIDEIPRNNAGKILYSALK